MGWEYRAVEWTWHDADYDEVFLGHRTKLIAEGWQEHIRAHWRPSLTGGACIMRRPKDEPKEEPVYEYVAVLDEDEANGQWDALKKRGWAQVRCVRLAGRLGHIHLMRRIDPTVATVEVESKDEPRLLTAGELRKVFRACQDAKPHSIFCMCHQCGQ